MSVEVLSTMVWINHGGIEMGIPLDVIKEVIKHPKIREIAGSGDGEPHSEIRNCPKCGLVNTYTGVCGYCGSRCE